MGNYSLLGNTQIPITHSMLKYPAMLKLISINIEGRLHFDTVTEFLKNENPDCMCLQEVPTEFLKIIESMGYHVTFVPMQHQIDTLGEYTEGICIASRIPFSSYAKYYHQPETQLPQNVPTTKSQMHHPYIFAEIKDGQGDIYNIVTTHIMVTADGLADEHQIVGVTKLLELLSDEPDHLICGDFNMPRGYNHLYENMTAVYKDNIPAQYKSSLDKNLHRLSGCTDLNAPIFDIYMVDHLFSRADYHISDVRLQFGISDHAAIVATISK